ncbi:hypothetical protein TEA_007215 [Camellia sinensis var. sinensis]|uniref:ALIX V-shaped domain-containing protein n=1 Tax=Camellia sinensis var. sinensis TaxID=542762 RepID=A0A4S4D9K2_CAMSN|nr:hypothetical protein TEA_007215 [Camellia sinensis var. sinensis]
MLYLTGVRYVHFNDLCEIFLALLACLAFGKQDCSFFYLYIKIESALPTLSRPIMSLDANEDAILGALKQSLRQLETLGAQRAGLEDMLKEMKRKLSDLSMEYLQCAFICVALMGELHRRKLELKHTVGDDILPKLMASTGSYEDLFRKEISKYDHICEEIAQNVEAQEQLLFQIQAQNEEFAAIFNLEDYKASREKTYKQIEAAIAKYREIKENINEGLKFYVTLQDAITNIKQQCSDFVMTRNIQCREMIEDVQRQMAGFSFQDKNAGSAYNYPAVGQPHQTQRSSSQQQQTDPANIPHQPRPHSSYYQHPEQPPMPGYGHPPPPYGMPQQPPPPYHVPAAGGPPYPPQQPQQQPAVGHEYGQPAYPGWRGPYYNAPAQQQGNLPRPPYTLPSPYPPPHHQGGGYYK